ncbi:N-acetylneuraminate 9-O-acetyltransferase [Rhipicephalus sanguineus]|uniref:N-acetylneuraminate 9-O-acetyltransferase n=1 Tax=Rhipicephalus sanguineus TaxID=34632 RepID=UPI0018944FCF|nr:N-acetylneuraminate 9-O-acetyltransferase [Rhipicephalus sanguineus]
MVEEGRHITASSEFIHRINARNCKLVACFVVVGFVLYHGVIHLTYGIDTCKWLLSDGRFQGYHVWQPYGCMLHTYTNAESRMCLRYIAYWGGKNHIVFVGDSRIRQLYGAFVQQVQPSPAPQQGHRDLLYEEKDLHLTVVRCPHPSCCASPTFVLLGVIIIDGGWDGTRVNPRPAGLT